MSDLKLGHLIDTPQQRDAIHIAVAPVVATERLSPGQHVGFVKDDAESVGPSKAPIGVVDPFLKAPVFAGERFWLFLYPNTITALRHEWAHPAFGAEATAVSDKAASEMWLRDFAEDMRMSYGALIEAANDWLASGEWHTFHGFGTPDRAHADIEAFWRHFEIVTGKKVGESDRESFFNCSC